LYTWSHSPLWHVMEINYNPILLFSLTLSMQPIANLSNAMT
jgi:hypothetical protein